MKKKLIMIAIIIVMTLSMTACSSVEDSYNSIMPYLGYVGEEVPIDDSVELENDLYERKNAVEFMGEYGNITYLYDEDITIGGTKQDIRIFPRKTVVFCSWKSNNEMSEKEFEAFKNNLSNYFEDSAHYITQEYSTGDTKRYFWEDNYSDLCVTYGHDLSMYDSEGYVEILWGYQFCKGNPYLEGYEGFFDEL